MGTGHSEDLRAVVCLVGEEEEAYIHTNRTATNNSTSLGGIGRTSGASTMAPSRAPRNQGGWTVGKRPPIPHKKNIDSEANNRWSS